VPDDARALGDPSDPPTDADPAARRRTGRPLVLRPFDAVAVRPGRIGSTARWVDNTALFGCLLRFLEVNGRDRTLVMASQAFTAIIPLIIVAASFASSDTAVADALIERFQLTGESAEALQSLFSRPPGATGGITILGLIVLFYSVSSLARYIQRTFEAAWQLPPLGMRGTLNGLSGIGLLLLQVVVIGLLVKALGFLPGSGPITFVLRLVIATALWQQIQFLLLSRRVPRRRLLPGSLTAALGQAVVTIYSVTWMPHIIAVDAQRYGIIGVTFALLTWLIVVCAGVVAAAVVAAEWDSRIPPRAP
jgi:membrane protein